jgi:hypothetical protein
MAGGGEDAGLEDEEVKDLCCICATDALVMDGGGVCSGMKWEERSRCT